MLKPSYAKKKKNDSQRYGCFVFWNVTFSQKNKQITFVCFVCFVKNPDIDFYSGTCRERFHSSPDSWQNSTIFVKKSRFCFFCRYSRLFFFSCLIRTVPKILNIEAVERRLSKANPKPMNNQRKKKIGQDIPVSFPRTYHFVFVKTYGLIGLEIRRSVSIPLFCIISYPK